MRRLVDNRGVLAVAFLAIGAALGWAGASMTRSRGDAPDVQTAPRAAEALPAADPRLPDLPSPARFIAVGGGADPQSAQVSIAQDIRLAGETLGEGGLVLFEGGPGIAPVHVLDDAPERGDRLIGMLADFFAPRDDRRARYAQAPLDIDGPATRWMVTSALESALAQETDAPLLVYVAGHGDVGETPSESAVQLWGGEPLLPADLADVTEARDRVRPLRAVIAACFSGGFAELAFAQADGEAPTSADRCALMSTTWDREASGCDPDPDRAAQEGYSLHFLHALRGTDRHGRPAPIDLDGDGRVSLLEAHARARIEGHSIDVPTTTSERLLGVIAPEAGAPEAEVSWPEEQAVIDGLGRDLARADATAALSRLASLDEALDAIDARVAEAEEEVDARWADLRIALLGRWPALDDPWRASFAEAVERDRHAIAELLERSPEARALADARSALDAHTAELERLLVEQARMLRLVRAYENLAAARRLRAAGGDGWERFERMLACERTVPG